jgi:hypothetical protein
VLPLRRGQGEQVEPTERLRLERERTTPGALAALGPLQAPSRSSALQADDVELGMAPDRQEASVRSGAADGPSKQPQRRRDSFRRAAAARLRRARAAPFSCRRSRALTIASVAGSASGQLALRRRSAPTREAARARPRLYSTRRGAPRSWRFAGPMPRFGQDLQRSSRGHRRGRESDGCLCPVGVAMAEVGDDETVTLLFARNDRPERAFDRSALPTRRAQDCHGVAGCRISGEPAVFVRIPSELPRREGGLLAFVRSVSVGCDQS